MRTFKFLFCAACLCGVGIFAKTALTQEKDSTEQPSLRPQRSGRPSASGVDPENLPPGDGSEREFTRTFGPVFYGPKDHVPIMEAPLRARRVTRTVVEMRYEAIPKEELEASKKLHEAIQSLKTGMDDAARKAAADIIQQQLTMQFESDLKQREKELVEVEQRVKSLREQLDKRKAAQADIVNLRLQTLVNDANGLGFPDSSSGITDQFDVQTQPADFDEQTQPADAPRFEDEPTPAAKRSR